MPIKKINKMSVLHEEKGAIAVIAAVVLIVILGMAALVVDFGYGISVKTELQEVADSAALAAAGNLNGVLSGMTLAEDTALTFSALNTAAGESGEVSLGSVELGVWTMPDTFLLSADPTLVNAVRVSTRRDSASGTALPTTFGPAINQDSMEVGAAAVAKVVGSACTGPTCGVQIPIVLCDDKLEGTPPYCSVRIRVSPTTTQDGGITSFFLHNANANNIGSFVTNPSLIPDVTTVPYPPPDSCYDTNNTMQEPNIVEMNEGTLTPIFTKIRDKYYENTDPCRTTGSGPDCSDLNGNGIWEWKTVVLVAHCNGGPVPQGACIRGFANYYIEEVCTAGYFCENEGTGGIKGIYGFADCDGGGTGGAIADMAGVTPITALVQ